MHNNKKIFAVIAIVILIGSEACAYNKGDFQIWNTNYQAMPIGKGTKLRTEEEFRYGGNAAELFYHHYEWGIGYEFDKRLELLFGYRLAYQLVSQKFIEEDEPFAIIIGRFNLWKLELEDRNRMEYRHFRSSADNVRYRNRFIIKYPFDFSTIKIAPYTSDEVFIASDSTGLDQNRLESGLEFILTKYVTTSVSYMMHTQKIKGEKWSEANVLWLKLRVAF